MKTLEQPKGFTWGNRQIGFIEWKGKDISFPRWRADFYYAPHLAETVFFDTELAYLEFQEESAKHTYSDYATFRKEWRNAQPVAA
jgi:hypothetical protein